MNDRVARHLEHLMNLMSPPWTNGWRAYCWHRAKSLASDPELVELPRLLTEAMKARTGKEA